MKQKYYLLFFALVFGFSGLVYGQTGIGTNAPHGSAQLEVQSTDKGVLIPRMTESQKNVITNPATGLLVYQTDGANAGFYYYDGTQWVHLGAQGPQGAIGPAGPTGPAGPNFAEEGFSATASAMSIVLNLPMQGWTVGSPYFNTTTFNPVTGIFTVPQTGCYQISATINYMPWNGRCGCRCHRDCSRIRTARAAPTASPCSAIRGTSPGCSRRRRGSTSKSRRRP